MRLRRSFEDLGPVYVELGRFLAARRDRIPANVAAELDRASVGTRPVPFSEGRALIERELRNDLDRLFVSFEETPARVGALTQSHRAMLPGDRPALVVLRRPGVRRELLAMRPVSDLVRRRLGDLLPLDPSETVGDFTAHVTHRRDMHFAAQTARGLQEVGSFGLRVPKVYRSHSSGSCITFEAPPGARPPDAAERRTLVKEVIHLALVEGIFFPDLVPERFAADTAGDLWLADPTEVFSLDPERMRGLAEVFAAVRREDVGGVSRALPLAGGLVPREDRTLGRELREAMGTLGGPLWRENPLSEVRNRSCEALRRGGASLPDEVAQMFRSLVAAEDLGGGKAGAEKPSTIAAIGSAEDLIHRYRDPAYVAARTIRKLARPDAYADYPRQVHALLSELQDGEMEVRFRHGGLDQLISKVDILANRLVFAFLIAALIVGSSMLGTFVEGGIQVLGVSIFGLVGFVFAAVLGLMLLFGIVRSGRL